MDTWDDATNPNPIAGRRTSERLTPAIGMEVGTHVQEEAQEEGVPSSRPQGARATEEDEPLYGVSRGPVDRRHGFARSRRRLLFGGLSSGVNNVNNAGVATNLNTGGTGTNAAYNPNACYCQRSDETLPIMN